MNKPVIEFYLRLDDDEERWYEREKIKTRVERVVDEVVERMEKEFGKEYGFDYDVAGSRLSLYLFYDNEITGEELDEFEDLVRELGRLDGLIEYIWIRRIYAERS